MIEEEWSRPGRRVVTVHGIPLPAPRRAPDDWRTQAACRDTDPAVFDFDPETGTATLRRARRALSICATCPVIVQCRTSATAAERAGADSARPTRYQVAVITGGLTPAQRHPEPGHRLCAEPGCGMPPWRGEALRCVEHATAAAAEVTARHRAIRDAGRRVQREARLAEIEAREAAS